MEIWRYCDESLQNWEQANHIKIFDTVQTEEQQAELADSFSKIISIKTTNPS